MKKGPLSHWKIKCSFLDSVQLLMIGQAIWVTNIDRNAKKQKSPPKSLKNKMFIFGLHSTSDDWPSNLSNEYRPKHKKMKKGPLSHQKIKCSFLDYIQLLMIGQVIRVTNVDQNMKKGPPKSSKNEMLIFGLCSTSDNWLSDLSDKTGPKCKKRPPKLSFGILLYYLLYYYYHRTRSDDNTEDCQKITQKTARIPPEDCQKTTRRLLEDCQKTTRRLPEYYYLSDSDLVRWCCYHVLSGVIPAPRTHMVGCFVLLLLMHFKCKY